MKQRDILLLLVPSFLIVFAWIVFNIYHSSVSSTISENLDMQIVPISPNFDTTTINQIKNRQDYQPIYEQQASSGETSTPALLPITIPIASSSSQASTSANINVNQSAATNSGGTAQ